MRYGSLFAGAGGFDLGFDAAGWECAWQVEIDPHARKVLEHWWPEVARHDDITRVGASDVQLAGVGAVALPRERGGERVATPDDKQGSRGVLDPVDLIVGGFPCQDLSVAGNRAGMVAGTRSGLFYEFVRIVKEMRDATAGASPRWVVWENVAGLLSLGDTLGSVYAAWDGIGAVVQEHRLIDSGRAFGVPQRRRRVLGVVGFDPRAESAPAVLAEPEGVRRDPAPRREAGQDVAGTPDESTEVVGCLTTSESKNQMEAHMGHLLPVAVSENQRGEVFKTDYVRSMATGGGKPGQGYLAVRDDLAVRRLTPTECERLMGWPDGHTEPAGADSHRYRLCGNGVIAPAARWLARRIERTEAAL